MQPMSENDKRLRDAVTRQIEWDPRVTASDIAVAAVDHVITLAGFVHNCSEKYAAEDVAKSVYGVQAVANDIEVKPKTARTDPEIARDITHAIRLDARVTDGGIKATVQDGFVTLSGAAEWHFQRKCVEICARNVPGVRGVMNHITVKPKAISPADVARRIEAALRRSAEVEAHRISLSATGGHVHLYGNVRSCAERDLVEQAAWSAPGVHEVIDHMSVVP